MRRLSQTKDQGTTVLPFSNAHRKCVYGPDDLSCEFCRSRGLGHCSKGLGAKRLEEMRLTAPTSAPGRPPPTPLDEVISPEDVLLLQYSYSKRFEQRQAPVIARFYKYFAFQFSPSIRSSSLRHAMLAFAAEAGDNKDLQYYHTIRACRALRTETSVSVGEADIYAAFLLSFLSFHHGDWTSFHVHRKGVIALLQALLNKGSKPELTLWPYCRLLLSSTWASWNSIDRSHLEFYFQSQRLIGPPQLSQSVHASIALFGNGLKFELTALRESLREQYSLLLQCLQHSAYGIVPPSLLQIVRIIRADSEAFLHSSEVPGLMNRISLRKAPPNQIVLLLYYRCCLLLISYLESDTLLSGIISDNSSIIAFSVIETYQEYCPAESPRTFDFWIHSKVLPLAGLALTPETFPRGTIHCPENVLILVETEWIIQQLEQYSHSTEAEFLQLFWAQRDIGPIERLAQLLRNWAGVLSTDFWSGELVL